MNFTDSATNALTSALNDMEQPFTAEMEESATSVTGCLKNVLQSASGPSQETGGSELNKPSAKVWTLVSHRNSHTIQTLHCTICHFVFFCECMLSLINKVNMKTSIVPFH